MTDLHQADQIKEAFFAKYREILTKPEDDDVWYRWLSIKGERTDQSDFRNLIENDSVRYSIVYRALFSLIAPYLASEFWPNVVLPYPSANRMIRITQKFDNLNPSIIEFIADLLELGMSCFRQYNFDADCLNTLLSLLWTHRYQPVGKYIFERIPIMTKAEINSNPLAKIFRDIPNYAKEADQIARRQILELRGDMTYKCLRTQKYCSAIAPNYPGSEAVFKDQLAFVLSLNDKNIRPLYCVANRIIELLSSQDDSKAMLERLCYLAMSDFDKSEPEQSRLGRYHLARYAIDSGHMSRKTRKKAKYFLDKNADKIERILANDEQQEKELDQILEDMR
jgi:hypothetical protein